MNIKGSNLGIKQNDKEGRNVLIFFGILLLVGLLTVVKYGAYLDQTSEQRIMYANWKEYAVRLLGEDHSFISSCDERGILKISIDEDRDHGMAAFYLAIPLFFIEKVQPYLASLLWHGYTFLLVYWGMYSLYLLCRKLQLSQKLSFLGVLLFFLSPRMFAESHYNNKDLVLVSFAFTLFYWGLRVATDTRWRDVIVFAAVGALMTNMKIIGLWYWGILGLYCIGYLIFNKRFSLKVAVKGITCIVSFVLIYILVTPACWIGIKEYIDYNINMAVNYTLWHDYVLFQGKMLHAEYTGMGKRYLPTMILITTPIVVLLLTAWGTVVVVADLIKSKGKTFFETTGFIFVILMIGGVPLFYAILAETPIYNGWRHFYFIYASMIMLAIYGCKRIAELSKHKRTKQIVQLGAWGYCIWLALGIAVNYPQEHSYFNIFAGKNVVETYELDYWDMSIREAYEVIYKENKHKEEIISVGAFNLPTMWGVEQNHKFLPDALREQFELVEDWEMADYIIVNTTYAFMYSKEQLEYVKREYNHFGDIKSYGNTICQIYYLK